MHTFTTISLVLVLALSLCLFGLSVYGIATIGVPMVAVATIPATMVMGFAVMLTDHVQGV